MGRLRWTVMATLLASTLGTLGARAQETRIQLTPRPAVSAARDTARLDLHRHDDALDSAEQRPPKLIKLGSLVSVVNAPKVQVGIEPLENDAILYHPVAATTSSGAATAQVSVVLGIKNLTGKALTLDKVRFEYQGGSMELAGGVAGEANEMLWWQNGRKYHETGNVLYLEGAVPSSLTIKMFFAGFSAPVVVTKPLKPYTRAFGLPFKASDLAKDEVWEGASTHGGGSQVFAYDMGVEGYAQSFGSLLPGKTKDKNDSYRVWGKPIYAMADGEVVHALNDCPNNPSPAKDQAAFDAQKANYWGSYDYGGAGNHFYIQHGDVIALYAHLQKGSLNPKLLTKGAKVKKGDLLGLAGNSGSSWAPHLHVHIRKETEPETGPYRPLLFNEGFVIEKKSYTAPSTNVGWVELTAKAIPGLAKERSYIWPAATHPYCAYAPNGSEVARHGIAAASYQAEFDKIWTCGYQPAWVDGYDVGGKTFFNLVMRKDDTKPWVARHDLTAAAYQAEFDTWSKAGFRLVHVDSYLSGGQVRYAAVWRNDGGPAIVAYHGASNATHQANFDKWLKDGWVPVAVSVVAPSGEPQITALYQKLSAGGIYARHGMTLDEYKTYFKQYGDQGFKLVYINGYTLSGSPRLSGIWYKTTPFGGTIAKHFLTGAQYQSEYTTQTGGGFSTRAVTGYDGGGASRFEGLWVK